LTQSKACPGSSGFTCSTLPVPLDHSGAVAGSLDLEVAVADNRGSRDVLVVLSGGPGQFAVELVPLIRKTLAPVLDRYRLVMIDQRGTGEGGIRCPELQEAVGGSDILAPPVPAVRSCAQTLGGDRSFYATRDTVADLDLLRRALGVDEWTLDGVSYGSFVAERYAMTYPQNVRALVLDSVVPHEGFDPLLRANLRRAAPVLRDACGEPPGCVSDPAADLAWAVRHGVDGVGILNALTLDSIIDPSFRAIVDVPEALRLARAGERSDLDHFVAQFRRWSASPADQLSAGLHTATLCADLRFPWGDATSPVPGRRAALRDASAELSTSDVWPFDRATAIGNGVVQSCLPWPQLPAPPRSPQVGLPDVPVLMLQGERDLSTPIEWSRREAGAAPDARLVVVPGAGHSVQVRAQSDAGRRAVYRFLRAQE
jgi:pimeloyl-ACP methyl ester carboxylesterase